MRAQAKHSNFVYTSVWSIQFIQKDKEHMEKYQI